MKNLKIYVLLVGICSCHTLYCQTKRVDVAGTSPVVGKVVTASPVNPIITLSESHVTVVNNPEMTPEITEANNALESSIDQRKQLITASLARVMVATAVLILSERNKLSLDSPLCKLLSCTDILRNEHYISTEQKELFDQREIADERSVNG